MVGPVKKFRAGAVAAALWENEIKVDGRIVPTLKATIDRRYKDSAGNWKSSGSFSRNEIPLAVHVLQQAFEAMLEMNNDNETEQPQVEEVVVE
ncbi:MAG: hypothetical protein PVI86_08025 [Phycisphaerae bacterium]